MIVRILRLLILLAVIAAALYLLMLNNAPVTLTFPGGGTWSARLGVVVLVTFAVGILLSAFISSWYALKNHFQKRSLERREKERLSFLDTLQRARGLERSGQVLTAEVMLTKLLKRDPTGTIIRVELAELLQKKGVYEEALQVVDEARALQPRQLELLLLAAELHQKMGNGIAALDILKLAFAAEPSELIAQKARNQALLINKFDDAFLYQGEIEKLKTEGTRAERDRICYQKLLLLPTADRLQALRTLVTEGCELPEALRELAKIEEFRGAIDEAAAHLARAAKASQSVQDWQALCDLWLRQKNPEKALSTLQTATRQLPPEKKNGLELLRALLLIELSNLDQAQTVLVAIPEKDLDLDLLQRKRLLELLLYLRKGENKEAQALAKELLVANNLNLRGVALTPVERDAPAARLSTP